MKKDRKSIRMKQYDYSTPEYYFITICSLNRDRIFGEIKNEEFITSNIGMIVKKNWFEIPEHFNNVRLDEFILMPNHLHGILELKEVLSSNVGVQYIEPNKSEEIFMQYNQVNEYQKMIPKSLGSIIRAFKASVTKEVRRNNFGIDIWQKNFYEHVIRNEKLLDNIREYIKENVFLWEKDKYFFD